MKIHEYFIITAQQSYHPNKLTKNLYKHTSQTYTCSIYISHTNNKMLTIVNNLYGFQIINAMDVYLNKF